MIGKLIGHLCIVNSIMSIGKTPMVVSCDESGVIKVTNIKISKDFINIQIFIKIILTIKNNLNLFKINFNFFKFLKI